LVWLKLCNRLRISGNQISNPQKRSLIAFQAARKPVTSSQICPPRVHLCDKELFPTSNFFGYMLGNTFECKYLICSCNLLACSVLMMNLNSSEEQMIYDKGMKKLLALQSRLHIVVNFDRLCSSEKVKKQDVFKLHLCHKPSMP